MRDSLMVTIGPTWVTTERTFRPTALLLRDAANDPNRNIIRGDLTGCYAEPASSASIATKLAEAARGA